MAALNFYIGVKRGGDNKLSSFTAGVAPAGTGVDVELNMQINNGTNLTGLTRKDVIQALKRLELYIIGGHWSKDLDIPGF